MHELTSEPGDDMPVHPDIRGGGVNDKSYIYIRVPFQDIDSLSDDEFKALLCEPMKTLYDYFGCYGKENLVLDFKDQILQYNA